jgi:homeobox-leucine zipper protein
MNADMWVQSPRLRNRSVNFLRYSKMTAEGHWAVMDVSIDGILGLEDSGKADLNVDNNVMNALQKGCRLLPSGCLVEDMGNGYCKVLDLYHSSSISKIIRSFRALLLFFSKMYSYRIHFVEKL